MEFRHKRLQNYVYMDKLGKGGSAYVVKVYDIEKKRTCALKLLNKDILGAKGQVKLFAREATVLQKLKHSHIIDIYDSSFDLEQGEAFILMQYMKHGNIGDYVSKKKDMKLVDKLMLIEDAAHALQYAHHQGILHRDIKPENIFIADGDTRVYACLGDFGVAKDQFLNRNSLTAAGMTTWKYLPLEVLNEEEKQTSLTDVYALGMSMYEIIAGRHAYNVENLLQFFKGVGTEVIQPPSAYDSSVTKEVDALCLQAIAANKKDRYTSLDMFIMDLKKCINNLEEYNTNGQQKNNYGNIIEQSVKEEINLETLETGIVNNSELEEEIASTNKIVEEKYNNISLNLDELQTGIIEPQNTRKKTREVKKLVNGRRLQNALDIKKNPSQIKKSIYSITNSTYQKSKEILQNKYVRDLFYMKSKKEKILSAGIAAIVIGICGYTMFNMNDVAEEKEVVKKEVIEKELAETMKKELAKREVIEKEELEDSLGKILSIDVSDEKLGITNEEKRIGSTMSFHEARGYRYYTPNKNEEEIFEILSKHAHDGNSEAMLDIAGMYRRGYGTEKDDFEAKKWLEMAVDKNAKGAFMDLGDLYREGGKNVKKQYDKALKYYQKALELENVNGTRSSDIISKIFHNIGSLYQTGGNGLEKDKNKALRYYKKACIERYFLDGQDISAMAATYAEDAGTLEEKYQKLFAFILKHSERGNREAMICLAKMYKQGAGTSKDYKTAVDWFKKAFEKGDTRSLIFIADLYKEGGFGIERDYKEAKFWYRKAADLGDSSGMVNLAEMYENGSGVEDDGEVVKWYRKAAELGEIKAMLNLGYFYENGYCGVEQDDDEAVKWHEIALKNGSEAAFWRLHEVYSKAAFVTEEDGEKAFKFYTEAMEKGYYMARELGDLYNRRYRDNLDRKKALTYYRSAYLRGDYSVLNIIGKMYSEGGHGLEKSYQDALKWYIKSFKRGDYTSLVHIGKLYEFSDQENFPKNYKIALECYKKALDEKNIKDFGKRTVGSELIMDITMAIANLYREGGYGVTKSNKIALEWYEKGLSNGSISQYDKGKIMKEIENLKVIMNGK